MSDIAERVQKITVEHLDVDASKVEPKASFIDDLGADSLARWLTGRGWRCERLVSKAAFRVLRVTPAS